MDQATISRAVKQATVSRSVVVSGQHTDRREFLRALAQSLEALLVHEGPATYDVAVKLHVRDGAPVSANVALDNERN